MSSDLIKSAFISPFSGLESIDESDIIDSRLPDGDQPLPLGSTPLPPGDND
ncbi:hypothetical protein KAR91_72550 [Candidatus Pacearchaeota archaeon]|nr:hypothetical protein [Candidatus Pacearchaeota archaeon]